MGRSRRRCRPPPAENSSRHHLPSAANCAGSRIPWVMIDRFAHRTKGDGDEVVRDEVADVTLSEISSTCTGKPIAVSLRVAEPPAVSRLYLHWPDGLRPEMSRVNKPVVIAVHSHSILFETCVPLDGCSDPGYYPIDYFVYTAPSRPKMSSSLRRLPTSFKSWQVDPVLDQYYKPHCVQQQRRMWRGNIGLLCRGDDEFTVAHLTGSALRPLSNLWVLHHTPAQTDMKWDLKGLPVPCYNGTLKFMSDSWQTDIVIPFDDRYLCWVDFYQGLLFVDVIAKDAKPPRYAPLPQGLDQRLLYIDHGTPDPARRVCVTDAGIMKFISISDDAGCTLFYSSCSAFNITTWTLINFEQMEWRKDGTIKSSEFWAALDIDKRLPCVLPKFPIMSLVDPNVICFMLEDNYDIYWLIEVNIKNKILEAVTLYIDEEEKGHTTNMFRGNIFCGISFVTSQFTRYMNKDAIKSMEVSKKLQEAKQRSMEKTGASNGKDGLKTLSNVQANA